VDWARQATKRLDAAGYRSGGARMEVVELLASERCAMTALEMDARLSAGRASVYRTLDQLEQLRLVQRVEIGGGAAGYERLDPDEHHHHLVCENCGRLTRFTSGALESAIDAISRDADFEVATHDVVLRGTCSRCGASRGS
jgi:Fur family transcriptional regulator, ferric uptake regulator